MTEPSYDDRRESCPLCGAALRRFDRDFRGHRIDACRGCGVKLMNPQYSDAYLDEFYSSYISLHEEPNGKWRSSTEVRGLGKRRSLTLLGEFVTPGRLLTIGCGDGLELGIAKELGWNVEGYDVDRETTAAVAARYGVPVHSGPIADLDLEPESYDAIFMDQVIEHPKDPSVYLNLCHRLLRPGGVLYLGTPNIGSLSNRLKTLVGRLGLRSRRRGKHYASKHHVFYYTPGVLRRLLTRRFGFEVLDVRGSLKPQKKRITPWLSRWLPSLDSGFLVISRKPAAS